MRFSVYVVCPLVLSLDNLNKQDISGEKKNFRQEKLILWLTFNPELALASS